MIRRGFERVPLAWRPRRTDRWTVEACKPDALRLRTGLGVPGEAWLELKVSPQGAFSRYEQRATFYPRGLAGRLYWFALKPVHTLALRAAGVAAVGRAKQQTTT